MNNQAELLPCPFCGKTVELTQTGRNQLTIKCKSCQIKRVQKVLRYSLDWLESRMIEDWNKRQPIIDIPGVKELVEALEFYKEKVESIARYTKTNQINAIEACMAELIIDGGRKAREYLKALEDNNE